MVRAPALQGSATRCGDAGELGDSLVRILHGGAGEPLGQLGLFDRPAQDDPGGRNAGGICRLLGRLFEGANHVELCDWVLVGSSWRVFHLSRTALMSKSVGPFISFCYDNVCDNLICDVAKTT
jgi:hypothetical protein